MSNTAKKISEERIRKLFNKGCYLKRFQRGQFFEEKRYDKIPKNLPSDEPNGTHIRIIRCYDENHNLIATVHLYRRPDGNIGGSGLPDPKRLKHKGRIYYTR